VQYLLVNLETLVTLASQTATVDLAPAASHTQALTYYTLALPAAHYACVLQAEFQDEWQVLEFKIFYLHNILSSECSTVYAIHDQDQSDTQLFTYDLNEAHLDALGPLYLGYDLEGLDIHPYTHQLYASSGKMRSRLYQVDGYTGNLTLRGEIGFNHVNALSFHPSGKLWGWSKKGLIQIDTDTGNGELVYAKPLNIQSIAWNNAGTLLYGAAYETSHSTLWVYDGQNLSIACDELPGEIEGLEMHPDNRLIFGLHDDDALSFHGFDVNQCVVVADAKITTPYHDIEAIAWPSANCTARQMALRAYFIALSEEDDLFIGEDRNLRITLEGQTYQGQLAEAVIPGPVQADGKLQLIAIPDTNDDGIDDFLITYPDGQQQELYYFGTTTEE
jgi:WD40 repeat protein